MHRQNNIALACKAAFIYTYYFVLKVFRSSDDKSSLIKYCLFSYGLPFIITATNVSSTLGYLDTLKTPGSCDEGKWQNFFVLH